MRKCCSNLVFGFMEKLTIDRSDLREGGGVWLRFPEFYLKDKVEVMEGALS